jgi:SAM-dependent methyltransferase
MSGNDTEILTARRQMAKNKLAFDALTESGEPGSTQEAFEAIGDDGSLRHSSREDDNYYLTDPVERRNFAMFLVHLHEITRKLGRKVLVAGCGEGLEVELLAQLGYNITAFDYAPNMVRTTRKRLENANLSASLDVGDATDLDLSKYPDDFTAVMFAQVAAFIPPVEGDRLLAKAIADLASRTPEGIIYLSTTYYEEPAHTRVIAKEGDEPREATYYARATEDYVRMLGESGLTVVYKDHFDAGPGDYKNQYFIAARNPSDFEQ